MDTRGDSFIHNKAFCVLVAGTNRTTHKIISAKYLILILLFSILCKVRSAPEYFYFFILFFLYHITGQIVGMMSF